MAVWTVGSEVEGSAHVVGGACKSNASLCINNRVLIHEFVHFLCLGASVELKDDDLAESGHSEVDWEEELHPVVLCLEEKAIKPALPEIVQVLISSTEERLSCSVCVVNHVLVTVYLPALVLQHAGFWVEQKPGLLVHVCRQAEFWLREIRRRWLVVLRRRNHGIEEEEDQSKQDGDLEAARSPGFRFPLRERDDLDVEDEGRIGRYRPASSFCPVSIRRWTSERSLLPLPELADSFIPAANDSAYADLEREWFSSCHAAVKHLSVRQLASVVNLDECTFRHERSRSFVVFLDFHTG